MVKLRDSHLLGGILRLTSVCFFYSGPSLIQTMLIQTLTDLNGLWLSHIHITFTNTVYFALNFHQNIVNLICERGVVSYWSAATAARPLWEEVAYTVFGTRHFGLARVRYMLKQVKTSHSIPVFTSNSRSKGNSLVEWSNFSLSSSSITSWVPGCFHSNHPTSCLILYCSRAAGPHRKGLEIRNFRNAD